MLYYFSLSYQRAEWNVDLAWLRFWLICVLSEVNGVGAEYLAANCEFSQRNVQQSGSTDDTHLHYGITAQFCTVSFSITLYVLWLRRSCIPLTRPWVKTDQGYTSFRILKTEATKQQRRRQQQQDKSPPHCEGCFALQAMISIDQLFSIVKTWLHASAFAKQNCHNWVSTKRQGQASCAPHSSICPNSLWRTKEWLALERGPIRWEQAAVHDTDLVHLAATWGLVLMWRLSNWKARWSESSNNTRIFIKASMSSASQIVSGCNLKFLRQS